MTRKEELEKIKEIIKENYKNADCGLFSTRNIVGDKMLTLYKGNYFQIDICYFWSYYEVFGTTKKEFDELYNYYNSLGGYKNERQ